MKQRTIVKTILPSFLALVLLTFGVNGATAQQGARITGTVRGVQTGQPIGSVTLMLRGTRIGARSGEDGSYLLRNVPPGEYVLVARMIGYGQAQQNVTVVEGQTFTADFNLTATAISLDEIVVTGTAAGARKKEVGNSIERITAAEFELIPVTDASQIISGRVPGVTVMMSSGQAGSGGGTIKIRGTSTTATAPEPLIYVDGIRVFNLPVGVGGGARLAVSPIQDINPADIERIEIVKGASATTIYGTEAAGGVIQIFTKKGTGGAPIWTAVLSAGVSKLPPLGGRGDPSQLYMRCGDLDVMFGLLTQVDDKSMRADKQYFEDPTCPADGTWDEMGLDQRYSLSVRGGFGDVNYFLSGNVSNSDGTLPTQESMDGSLRGNFDFSPADRLTLSLNTSYTRRESVFVPDGNNSNGFLLNVGRGHANYLKGGKGDDCDNVTAPTICLSNMYLFEETTDARTDHFTTGLTTLWEPSEQLTHRIALGFDYIDRNNRFHRPFGSLRTPEGFLTDYNFRHTKLSIDYTGSFRNNFGADLASTFSWGGQIFRDKNRYLAVEVEGFAGPGFPTIETGSDLTGRTDDQYTVTNAGFYFQDVLGWQDRLFVTGGVRIDGNSAFGDDFGLQLYPKLSAALTLSEYDFWPVGWFETFKLRGAMGESGKAPSAFAKLRTWSPVAGFTAPGFTPGNVGNPDVGPERTREYELGFDASLFRGRVGIEFTRWMATTRDALVAVTLPPSMGFLQSRTANIGTLENSGWELGLSLEMLRSDFIDWSGWLAASLLESDAVDLGGQEIGADNKAEFREGFPVPSYFGRVIENPDEFAEPIRSGSDEFLGNVFPDKIFGIGTTITLGGRVRLDVMAEHQGGHMLPNYTGYQNARRGSWHPCFAIQEKIVAVHQGTNPNALDDVRAMDRALCAITGSGFSPNSDYWVEKADFWKLRSLTLSYTIPQQWLRGVLGTFNSATVTLSGRNLHTWTNWNGPDPEVEDFSDRSGSNYDGDGDFGRRDYYTIPAPRTYMLSFRLGF